MKRGKRDAGRGTRKPAATARKRPTRGAVSHPASRIPHPAELFARLQRAYPDAHCALDHQSAFQLLVATILSAQCTDARVNMVTPALFAKYPDAQALADAEQGELEEVIRSTGFFRSKAKNLIGMATALVERHAGEVPRTMDELTKLPGVGRKTANVILGNAFGQNVGVVVDTHVTRLSNRMGLTTQKDPVKIEADLMQLFPQEQWTLLSHLFIDHGRKVCDARAPKCEVCVVAELCPSRQR
ncbi:MAG TPA: endonuclease III [Gemmatimonadaceae bacterium]|nr:endonuclease III [Gemmatimonadaceae bacterium]